MIELHPGDMYHYKDTTDDFIKNGGTAYFTCSKCGSKISLIRKSPHWRYCDGFGQIMIRIISSPARFAKGGSITVNYSVLKEKYEQSIRRAPIDDP